MNPKAQGPLRFYTLFLSLGSLWPLGSSELDLKPESQIQEPKEAVKLTLKLKRNKAPLKNAAPQQDGPGILDLLGTQILNHYALNLCRVEPYKNPVLPKP